MDMAKTEEKKEKKPGLVKKLKIGVRNLLTEPVVQPTKGDDEHAEDEAFADAEAITEHPPVEQISTEAFETELQGLIDGHGKVLAGKMQFVDLSDMKSKYPERWEEISEPLHALAASVIGMNLAQEDIYTRLQDSHLIVFAELSQAEAKDRCVKITREISELLVEQGVDSSVVAAKSVVGEVDGRAAIEDLDVEASSKPRVSAKTTKPRSKRR